MHKYKWDRELSVKFVKKYMELDVLWNTDNPLRSDPKARLKALTVLQNLVGDPQFTIDEVRRKIKSFRTTYTMELRKIRKSKNQAYVPTIAWFKIMDERLRGPTMENIVKTWKSLQDSRSLFLDHDYKKSMPTSSTDDNPVTTIKRSYSDDENFDEPVEEIYLDDNFQKSDDEEPEQTPKPSQSPPIKKMKYQNTRSPSTRIKNSKQMARKNNVTPVIQSSSIVNQNTNHDNTSVVRQPSSIYDMEDEFDIFGKSVAIQLRKLPLTQALKAQLDIQTLLINVRLNNQNNNDSNVETTEQIFQIEEYEQGSE